MKMDWVKMIGRSRMKVWKIFIVILPMMLMIFLLVPVRTPAQGRDLLDEAQACLACHEKQGIMKKFQNNELIEAYVDAEKYKASVHSFLACSDCHADFSSNKHPARTFKDKRQYALKSSLACRRCHTDDQIRVKPIHAGLLSREREGVPPVCSECHGAHSIKPVAKRNVLTDETKYCLGCHGHGLQMAFKSSERLSLKVDTSLLETSVHGKLSCSDCHYGFSSEEHPKRNFRSRRDLAIASADECRRCHFDKYTRFLDSVHYTKLSQGNLSAPVCTDCHSAHSTLPVGRERALSAKRCQKCHSDIYDIYAKSVHGNALFNEDNHDVPVCVDCHRAHSIKNPHTVEFRERIPELCSTCHANKTVMGKYGLSTDVLKTYLSDFHGVTLGFYIKQKDLLPKQQKSIAVCTDCHGTHSISTTTGPDAVIVKANLVKRCRACHAGASENFPDTWISHYEPSLAKAPLIFLIGLIYKIFTPFIVIGMILQILLHIWRYAANR
jgi:predicted CXXCH cytochrome family protein